MFVCVFPIFGVSPITCHASVLELSEITHVLPKCDSPHTMQQPLLEKPIEQLVLCQQHSKFFRDSILMIKRSIINSRFTLETWLASKKDSFVNNSLNPFYNSSEL